MITDRARSYTRDVVEAYTVFAEERGIPVRAIETGAGNSTGDALRALLESDDPTDAIYAGSEDIAMDVLHQAGQLGIRVPTELGLCSCVDSSTFNLTSPEVTGVFCNPRTIGQRAVGLLIDLIEGNKPEDRVIIVPTELRVRTSTRRRTA